MKQLHKSPKVTLVGAGPGCSELITLKGLEALKKADIILYDALVSPKLLEMVSPNIQKKYVGKRCGKHSVQQEEINKLLVEYAFTHGHVVRLKGGDPFVFGRASEEIDHLESFGIPVTVIPGVSSAIAVPSSQGIPLTKRGTASSFWVMTATKRDGYVSEDLTLAAQSSATMVILMGIRKLKEISSEIRRFRGSSTPIAIIQNGTLKDEIVHIGTLKSTSKLLNTLDTSKPGVIVVGNVVSEHPSFFDEEIQRVLHSIL